MIDEDASTLFVFLTSFSDPPKPLAVPRQSGVRAAFEGRFLSK